MQQLIYFLQKYKYFLFFIFLELVAIGLTINNNHFHKSKFLNSSNAIIGSFYKKTHQISNYFDLKAKNKVLNEENTQLRNVLEKNKTLLNNLILNTLQDTTDMINQFEYINANIYANEYHKTHNFLTLNRGENSGITKEMAVVNSKGIIGITEGVTAHYTRVQSILNGNSKINARLKNSNHFGTLIWDGKDYNTVQLTDMPRQATYQIGDTIITGGKSTIFPEGILIGTIKKIPTRITASNTLDITLFNDMSNLKYAYIISNLHKKELEELEHQSYE